MYGKAQLREDFIGFIDVSSDVTGNSLSSAILIVIQSTGIDAWFCHGEGCDGASAMSSQLRGVQAIIRKFYPLALYTHCANHCLNLALNKACTLPIIRNSLGVITESVNFFNDSAQRSHLLKVTIDTMYVEATIVVSTRRRLIHLCETRWIERHKSLMAFVELFLAVVKCLEEMQVTGYLLFPGMYHCF